MSTQPLTGPGAPRIEMPTTPPAEAGNGFTKILQGLVQAKQLAEIGMPGGLLGGIVASAIKTAYKDREARTVREAQANGGQPAQTGQPAQAGQTNQVGLVGR